MSRSAEFSRSVEEFRKSLDYEIARLNLSTPSEWYVDPVHRSVPQQHTRTQSALAAPSRSRPLIDDTFQKRVRTNDGYDRFAAEYFPCTFSASYALDATPKPSKDLTPEPTGLPGPEEPWKLSPRKRVHPMSYKSQSDIDKMYIMSDVMPATATATVALTTPYQLDLAKLRLQRLRIEESHLLEVKRLEELERIRGPKPKWYELKTPEFHYEAHKNNALLHRSKSYQELYDKRMRLVNSSRQFRLENAFV